MMIMIKHLPKQKYPVKNFPSTLNDSRETFQESHELVNNSTAATTTNSFISWQLIDSSGKREVILKKNNNHNNTKKFPKLPARYVR